MLKGGKQCRWPGFGHFSSGMPGKLILYPGCRYSLIWFDIWYCLRFVAYIKMANINQYHTATLFSFYKHNFIRTLNLKFVQNQKVIWKTMTVLFTISSMNCQQNRNSDVGKIATSENTLDFSGPTSPSLPQLMQRKQSTDYLGWHMTWDTKCIIVQIRSKFIPFITLITFIFIALSTCVI